MTARAAALLACVGLASVPQETKVPEFTTPEFGRFLFIAVLEGLLEDGPDDGAVKKILEQNDAGLYVNFVYACDICTPTAEALRCYSMRREFFYGRKGEPYVGTAGLPAEIAGLLSDAALANRREGLKRLVDRYVDRRMKLLRLSAEERAAWKAQMEMALKKASEMMRRANPDMKECPSCSGSVLR